MAGSSHANTADRHRALAHVTTTTSAPITTTTLVSVVDMAKWSHVNQCEESGNWHANGALYSGGLGIARANWVHFGGLQFAPYGAAATPEQQVVIAKRIEASGGVPNYVPDQNGCAGGW